MISSNDYKLPVCDVEVSRRNFPGVETKTYYSLADLQSGDTSGTTETDSKTNPPDGGYTKINQKSGKETSRGRS